MSHLDEGALHAMLDGDIEPAELTALQRHLADCADCRARLEEARELRGEAFRLIEVLDEEEAPVPAAAHAALMAEPAALPVEPVPLVYAAAPRAPSAAPAPSRRAPAWIRPLALAATVVAAVGIGYSFGRRAIESDLPAAADLRSSDEALTEEKAVPENSAAAAAPAPAPAPTPTPAAPATAPSSGLAAPSKNVARAKTAEGAVKTLGFRKSAKPASAPTAGATKPLDSARLQEPVPTAKVAHELASAELKDSARDAAGAAAKESSSRKAISSALARQNLRVDELVATAQPDRAARAIPISAAAAIRTLGGVLRLVEGFDPERFELAGDTVRVQYRTAFGPLSLIQWRTESRLQHRLIPPPAAPADSVTAWGQRVK